MAQRILVVDDNRQVVESLAKLLMMEGYEVSKAYDGVEALQIFGKESIDLILLDVMMPKLNGLSALMKIRTMRKVPVIILSAKTEESDIVSGLIMGADDYVTKPYNSAELMARIQAQLRRYIVWNEGIPQKADRQLVNGSLVLDLNSKSAVVNGREVKLTPKEYGILEFFMENIGHVFSAEEIYEHVWQDRSCYAVENTVMVHIRKLREKIEVVPKEPKYIKVVWGIGYKMEKQEA